MPSKNQLKQGLYCLALLFFAQATWAQTHQSPASEQPRTSRTEADTDTSRIDVVTLIKGSTLVGHIVTMTATQLTIETQDKVRVTIDRSAVKFIQTRNASDYSGAGYAHRSAPSLFLTQSAFMLPKGKGYYETQYFSTHIVEYGLTDNVTIGGGLLGLFALRVKAGVTVIPNLRLAVATEVIGFPFYISSASGAGGGIPFFGATYGMATFGTPDRFFNFTGGIAYSSLVPAPFGVLSLGGFARIGKNIGIMSDNVILPNIVSFSTSLRSTTTIGIYVPTVGLRFLNRTNSFDLGLIGFGAAASNSPISLVLPYIGMKAHF